MLCLEPKPINEPFEAPLSQGGGELTFIDEITQYYSPPYYRKSKHQRSSLSKFYY